MPGKGLYIEVAIHAPMDEVWRLTQEPAVHERWDLRFSTIRYLPQANGEPQRFLYETRIGFGLRIAGEGESTGTFDSKTERTSALRFSSDSKLSLIRSGSGYWKYIETATGVRFFTWYDYAVRFGFAGRLLDSISSVDRLGHRMELRPPAAVGRDRPTARSDTARHIDLRHMPCSSLFCLDLAWRCTKTSVAPS